MDRASHETNAQFMNRSLLGGNRVLFPAVIRALVSRFFPGQVAPDRVNSALCKQPGIAAVEDVEVISSAELRISAFVVLTADTPDPDCVVRCAAESLRRESRADEVILAYIDASGCRRGILIAGIA